MAIADLSSTAPRPWPTRDRALLQLLAFHYGDGGVYLPRHAAQGAVLDAAKASGFVSDEGFLTPKGRRLLARGGH